MITKSIMQLINRIRGSKATDEEMGMCVKSVMDYLGVPEKEAVEKIHTLRDDGHDIATFNMVVKSLTTETDVENGEGDEQEDDNDNTDNSDEEETTEESNDEKDGDDEEEKEEETVETEKSLKDVRTKNMVTKNSLRNKEIGRRALETKMTPRGELTLQDINQAAGKWMENLKDSTKGARVNYRVQEMFAVRDQMKAEGEPFTFVKAVNTLTSGIGANNVSIEDSIIEAIVAFSFTDEHKRFGLASSVRRVPTTSNTYHGQIMKAGTVSDRTQGVDVSTNDQGDLISFSANLAHKKQAVSIDYSAMAAVGNPTSVIQQSLAEGLNSYIDTSVQTAINAASNTVSLGLGAAKALNTLTYKQWQDLKSKVLGGSARILAMSSGTYDVFQGLSDSQNRPIFVTGYTTGQNIGENRVVLSDVMPTGAEAQDVATARDIIYLGDLNRAVAYVFNTVTGAAGVEYNWMNHSVNVYNHFSDADAVEQPGLIGIVKTKTA